jgi:hypothetical protein
MLVSHQKRPATADTGIPHRQILPSFPTNAGVAVTAFTAPVMVYMLRQVATMKNAASTSTTMLALKLSTPPYG